ncbi:MAG: transposase [Rhodothermales bacterium]
MFATDGKDASTVKRFKQHLIDHGGDPSAIEEMCCDMSPAFISGVEKQFPEAHLTFDKFHVMKVLNDAVDQVRRDEIKDRPELKGSRYIWLKNQNNLNASQTDLLEQLTIKKLNLKTSHQQAVTFNISTDNISTEDCSEFANGFIFVCGHWITFRLGLKMIHNR